MQDVTCNVPHRTHPLVPQAKYDLQKQAADAADAAAVAATAEASRLKAEADHKQQLASAAASSFDAALKSVLAASDPETAAANGGGGAPANGTISAASVDESPPAETPILTAAPGSIGMSSLLQDVASALPKLAELARQQEALKNGTITAASTSFSLQKMLQKALKALGMAKPGLVAAKTRADVAFRKVRIRGRRWGWILAVPRTPRPCAHGSSALRRNKRKVGCRIVCSAAQQAESGV
jgi:hypothetical protein